MRTSRTLVDDHTAGDRQGKIGRGVGWGGAPALPFGSPALIPVSGALLALAFGLLVGLRSPQMGMFVISALLMAIVFVLRWDRFAALIIVVVSLIQDQYTLVTLPGTFPVVSVVLAFALLGVIFFTQVDEHSWARVPMLGIWALLLVLAAPHILQGVVRLESVRYFAQTFVSALAMWVVGVQVVRNTTHLRWLMTLFSVFGTFIALHSAVLATTGVFLFETPAQVRYLAAVSNFTFTNTTTIRAGSFIGSPDWNGVFLAMLAFLPLALLFETTSRSARVFYGAELALILAGLFFTYSTAAWAALAVGVTLFGMLYGDLRARLALLGAMTLIPTLLALVFPRELKVLLAHFTAGGQITLRLGAWLTGLRIVAAHPLTGIGLGYDTYLARAPKYQVALQTIQLAHPHDSYIELAAMGGLTVAIAFLALLGGMFRLAIRAYRRASGRQRILLLGALSALVCLTVNSVAINGWTLAPLAAIGWMLAGAVCSPALYQTLIADEPAVATQPAPRVTLDARALTPEGAPAVKLAFAGPNSAPLTSDGAR